MSLEVFGCECWGSLLSNRFGKTQVNFLEMNLPKKKKAYQLPGRFLCGAS